MKDLSVIKPNSYNATLQKMLFNANIICPEILSKNFAGHKKRAIIRRLLRQMIARKWMCYNSLMPYKYG